jgi:dimethylargininase
MTRLGGAMGYGTALVRQPSSRLADGLLTYLVRVPVDLALARSQHEGYRQALAESGWTVREVAAADDHPDSVFVEDTVVYCDGLAVLTRSGAPQRRGEVAGTERAVIDAGVAVVRIDAPGTLDGGDVLQVGSTVYVGIGGRTNAEGIRQLGAHLADRGRTVVPVPLGPVLHLKSAVTALPDGTVLAERGADLVDLAAFRSVRVVDEEAGCHVVPLGDNRVLIAASAPRTAGQLASLGLDPIVVDISEFEKLEGCVTCLNVLLPDR